MDPTIEPACSGKDNPYITVTDPQCPIPANLPADTYPSSLSCQLSAVAQVVPAGTTGAQQFGTNADGSPRYGVIVLQNPKPGTQGTLGQMTFEMPGTYRFDANLSKTFRHYGNEVPAVQAGRRQRLESSESIARRRGYDIDQFHQRRRLRIPDECKNRHTLFPGATSVDVLIFGSSRSVCPCCITQGRPSDQHCVCAGLRLHDK